MHLELNKSRNNMKEKNIHAIKCPSIGDKGIIISPQSCTCDGYHTFGELYEHRHVLFISFCKKLLQLDRARDTEPSQRKFVWRSQLHRDGSSYEGWFLMGIGEAQGEQVSYHLPMSKWNETNFVETLERAPEWDGHNSDNVPIRILKL